MNTVPNLDCMTRDDLSAWLAYIGRTGRPQRDKAAALIGDRRKGYLAIAGHIRNYAVNKYVAMQCRTAGRVGAAIVYERICDMIYSKLPDDLRW